jgi:hypothetical protein
VRPLPTARELAEARFARELRVAKRNHAHYWIAIIGYRVEPSEHIRVTHADVRVPPEIGCFICESPYPTPNVDYCPGDPLVPL